MIFLFFFSHLLKSLFICLTTANFVSRNFVRGAAVLIRMKLSLLEILSDLMATTEIGLGFVDVVKVVLMYAFHVEKSYSRRHSVLQLLYSQSNICCNSNSGGHNNYNITTFTAIYFFFLITLSALRLLHNLFSPSGPHFHTFVSIFL